MKKIGAETIIIAMLIPILLAFGGYVHTKIGSNNDKIIELETSREYTKDDIKEIKRDIKEILRRIK